MSTATKPIVQHVTEGGAPIWRKPMLTTPFFECYEPLIETRAFRMWGGYNTLTYFSADGDYRMTRKVTAKRVGDCPAGGTTPPKTS